MEIPTRVSLESPFRNAALQTDEYRTAQLILGPSGEGSEAVLYSICSF
jgi:hypothetical protein